MQEGLINKFKEKLGLIEASRTTIPVQGNSGGSVSEAYNGIIDNIKQTAFIDEIQQLIISAWMAYNSCDDEEDIQKFSEYMVLNLLETSVSVGGYRSEQLQNIAVGAMSREWQEHLAEIKAGSMRSGEMQDVI